MMISESASFRVPEKIYTYIRFLYERENFISEGGGGCNWKPRRRGDGKGIGVRN